MEISPLTCRELMHFALYTSKIKRADLTIQYLKQLIQIEPDNVDALFLLGSEYAEINLIDEGVEAMEKALQLSEEAHLVRFQLAMLQLSIGENQKAIDGLTHLEDLPEEALLYHYAKGMLALMDEHIETAMDWLTKGLSLPTDNQPLQVNMQALLDKIKRAEKNNETSELLKNEDESDDNKNASKLFLSIYDKK